MATLTLKRSPTAPTLGRSRPKVAPTPAKELPDPSAQVKPVTAARNWRNEADWTPEERHRRSLVLDGFTVVANVRGTELANTRGGKKGKKDGPDVCLVGWAVARGLAVWVDRIHSGKLEDGGWGNPYEIDKTDPRPADVKHAEVCDRYEADIAMRPELHARIVPELAGKVLLCWCRPRRCHADALALIANGARENKGRAGT